jgi:hypothetical protein
VDAHEHAVLGASFRDCPHRRHPAGFGVEIVDAAGLGRQDVPSLDQILLVLYRPLGVLCRDCKPALVELGYST